MKNIILITDPNEDPDDLVALIFASALIKTEKINLLGVVSTVGTDHTRVNRAKYAKGVLANLKTNVPVCVGDRYIIDYETRRLQDDIFIDSKQLPKLLELGADVETDADKFITNLLTNAEDNSVTIVDIAGMTDLANMMKNHSKLFNQKVAEICLMSNFSKEKQGDKYEPDLNAHNNQIDVDSTNYVYDYVQKNNITTYVMNSKNTKKVPVSMKYYEDLKANGGILANHACDIQKVGLKQHYDNILIGKAEPKYTLEWFYNTFTTYKTYEQRDFDTVWRHVDRLYLYDPLTMLIAIDEYRNSYFDETSYGVLKLCSPKEIDKIYKLFVDLPKIAINY